MKRICSVLLVFLMVFNSVLGVPAEKLVNVTISSKAAQGSDFQKYSASQSDSVQNFFVDGVTYSCRPDVDTPETWEITSISLPTGCAELVIPEKLGDRKVTMLHFREADGARVMSSVSSLILPRYMNCLEMDHNPTCVTPSADIGGRYLITTLNSYFPDLEKVQVAEGNEKLSAEDGVLYDSAMKTMIHYPKSRKNEEFREPSTLVHNDGYYDGVKYLKTLIFSDNQSNRYVLSCEASSIEKAVIPSNIKTIFPGAFFECRQLKEVVIQGEGLEDIDEKAFYGCVSLGKVALPQSLRYIKSEAFYGCSSMSLASPRLPEKLECIDDRAFLGTKVRHVIAGGSLSVIGRKPFDSGTKVVLPKYFRSAKSKAAKASSAYLAWGRFPRQAVVIFKKKKKSRGVCHSAEDTYKIWAEKGKKNITIKKGKKQQLWTRASLYREYSSTEIAYRGYLGPEILSFTSSNPKVVKVTSGGKLKALKKGTATITVKYRLELAYLRVKGYQVKVKVTGK